MRPGYILPSSLLSERAEIPLSPGERRAAKHRATRDRRTEARLIGYPKHSKAYPPALWANPYSAETAGSATTCPA